MGFGALWDRRPQAFFLGVVLAQICSVLLYLIRIEYRLCVTLAGIPISDLYCYSTFREAADQRIARATRKLPDFAKPDACLFPHDFENGCRSSSQQRRRCRLGLFLVTSLSGQQFRRVIYLILKRRKTIPGQGLYVRGVVCLYPQVSQQQQYEYKRAGSRRTVTPFRTAVPFGGQVTYNLDALSP